MRRGIAEKLGLGTRKVDLSFTTTGNSCQLYKDELEVEFVLQSLKGNYTSNLIQAVTLPQVSRSFRRPRLNMESFPYLASIDDYTENYDTNPTHATVDLLIGNPYSLILGHEEKIKGPTEGSPIAVKTKLGTCVSGNLASQALQEDQTSHTTTATEVIPASTRRMLTSTANSEAEPSPHVTPNGNVSTSEAEPSPHVTPNGNVSTQEAAPSPHVTVSGNVSTPEAAPSPHVTVSGNVSTSEAVPSPQVTVSGNVSNPEATPSPNVTTKGNVSKTTPSLHAATNGNVLTTAAAAATTEETSIAKTQSSTNQGVWSLPIPREPRESVTLQRQAIRKPDTVTSAKCQSLRAQNLGGFVIHPIWCGTLNQ